jgi:hypothetical protein
MTECVDLLDTCLTVHIQEYNCFHTLADDGISPPKHLTFDPLAVTWTIHVVSSDV